MSLILSPLISAVHSPPVSEVRRWPAGRPHDGRELIDLCQAVPDYAPAPGLTEHLPRLLTDPLMWPAFGNIREDVIPEAVRLFRELIR